jgi:hypothetical protein
MVEDEGFSVPTCVNIGFGRFFFNPGLFDSPPGSADPVSS